jgi:putative endonuclease
MAQYHVYIVSSRSGVLYIGMTNNLERRMYEHKHKLIPGFTAKYNVNRLVYFEAFERPIDAIRAEKRIKGWTRAKKIALIESNNRQWKDLSEGWFIDTPAATQVERSDASRRSETLRYAQGDSHAERSDASPRPEILRCAQDDVVGVPEHPSYENQA